MKSILALLAHLCLSPVLFAAAGGGNTIYISAGQSIQAAIDAASAGDTIVVGPGTYKGLLTIQKEITLSSSAGPGVTIIDGQRLGTTMTVEGAATIMGFTITGGWGTSAGGMNLTGNGTRIIGNVFAGNQSGSGGAGAIRGNGASPFISGNVFTGNSGSGRANDTTVMFINFSSPVIENNLFHDNAGRGLSIAPLAQTQPVVINNTFVRNHEAIWISAQVVNPNLIVQNNILAYNKAGLYVQHGPLSATWSHNLLFGNTTDYLGVDSLTGLYGNLFADPMFVDLMGGDFHLRGGSAAIDAGANQGAPGYDFEGNFRPYDGNGDGLFLSDIGAFEYIPEPATPALMALALLAILRRGRRVETGCPGLV